MSSLFSNLLFGSPDFVILEGSTSVFSDREKDRVELFYESSDLRSPLFLVWQGWEVELKSPFVFDKGEVLIEGVTERLPGYFEAYRIALLLEFEGDLFVRAKVLREILSPNIEDPYLPMVSRNRVFREGAPVDLNISSLSLSRLSRHLVVPFKGSLKSNRQQYCLSFL